jgi:hypothetical protein
MIGDQVDGAIAIDAHEAAAGMTAAVRIPALPSDRQHVVVPVPAGTANKTVLVLPGAGAGSPPGDLRILVLVRPPVSAPRTEPPPPRPPGRAPGVPVPPGSARTPSLALTLVILAFVVLLGLGPGLLVAGILGASSPGPAVPTCNGRVMGRSDLCSVMSNGTGNFYDYSQMLARERSEHNIGVGFQIGVGALCCCLLLLLTGIILLRRRRRSRPTAR